MLTELEVPVATCRVIFSSTPTGPRGHWQSCQTLVDYSVELVVLVDLWDGVWALQHRQLNAQMPSDLTCGTIDELETDVTFCAPLRARAP